MVNLIKYSLGMINYLIMLCLSIFNLQASGGMDKKINIWSTKENKLLKCFIQHKDSITVDISLIFAFNSENLVIN